MKNLFKKLFALILVIAVFTGIILGLTDFPTNDSLVMVDASVSDAQIGVAYDGIPVTPTKINKNNSKRK